MAAIKFKNTEIVERVAELVAERDELVDMGADTDGVDAELARLVAEQGKISL